MTDQEATRLYNREWYRTHKESARRSMKKWRKKNKAHISKYNRDYRELCKQFHRED